MSLRFYFKKRFTNQTFSFLLLFSLAHAGLSVSLSAQNFSPLGSGIAGGYHNALCLFADTTDNSLYIGGNFTQAGGITTCDIARWDGTKWSAVGTKGGAHDYYNGVSSIIRYKGMIYAAGAFASIDSVLTKGGLARWDGTQWHSAGNFTVNTPSPDNSGRMIRLRIYNDELYAMGVFDSINGIPASGIAKFDGTNWHTVVPFFTDHPGWQLTDAIYYKNEFYIAGNFGTTMGLKYDDIMRWDGTNFKTLGNGLDGANSQVNTLKIYKGNLYATGIFYKNDGDPGDCIASWDGNVWSEVCNGIPYQSSDMIVFGDELYYGDEFNTSGPNSQITQIFNGTDCRQLNSTFTEKVHGGDVGCFAVLNKHLYIAGRFDSIDNAPIHSVAMYNYVPTIGISENTVTSTIELYPNPFSQNTTLTYKLPKGVTNAFLKVYDIRGGLICSYPLSCQENALNISANDFENGVYLYGVESENYMTAKKKMVVVK